MAQQSADKDLYFSYDTSGKAVSVNDNGTEYYCLRNGQADIVGPLDQSGTKVVSYTYDSWGKLISTEGTLASTLGVDNPLRYRGYYYAEPGFYWLLSRYYDPEVGRFINADSYVATGRSVLGLNMYAYCYNNPVNLGDPTGNRPQWLEEFVEWVEEGEQRIKHTLKIMARTVASPFKAITAEAGVGIGLGGHAEVVVNGVPVGFELGNTISDSIVYDKDSFDVINSSGTEGSINIANIFDFSISSGNEHSYFDSSCTCNFLHSSFGEKYNCPANVASQNTSGGIGFAIGGYFLLGFEVAIGIDFRAWENELMSIFNESWSYERGK